MKNFQTNRDKAILCGLFLSKYNYDGLKLFGFSNFKEAYNVLGLAIGVKKNYRDELDPLFPNTRSGWHNRKLRDHCQRIYDLFHEFDLKSLAMLVSSIAGCSLIAEPIDDDITQTETYAKRLLTGRAAENYFLQNYHAEPEFSNLEAIDVTETGCGFDFRLQNNSDSPYLAVEVKGMQVERGDIQLTDKEYSVAEKLRNTYYIYIVKNFKEKPYAVKFKKSAK